MYEESMEQMLPSVAIPRSRVNLKSIKIVHC